MSTRLFFFNFTPDNVKQSGRKSQEIFMVFCQSKFYTISRTYLLLAVLNAAFPQPQWHESGPLTCGHMRSICNLMLELSESSKTFGQVDILSSMLGSAHNNRDDWETMSKQRKKKHQWCLKAKSLCKNKMMSRIKTRHNSM